MSWQDSLYNVLCAVLVTAAVALTTWSVWLADPRHWPYISALVADVLYILVVALFVILYRSTKRRTQLKFNNAQPWHWSVLEIAMAVAVAGISSSLVLGDLLAKKEADEDKKESIAKNSFYAASGFFAVALLSWLFLFTFPKSTKTSVANPNEPRKKYYDSFYVLIFYPLALLIFAIHIVAHLLREKKTIE